MYRDLTRTRSALDGNCAANIGHNIERECRQWNGCALSRHAIKTVNVFLAQLRNRPDHPKKAPSRRKEDGRLGADLTSSRTESRLRWELGGSFFLLALVPQPAADRVT
jgi:hypothetical protein